MPLDCSVIQTCELMMDSSISNSQQLVQDEIGKARKRSQENRCKSLLQRFQLEFGAGGIPLREEPGGRGHGVDSISDLNQDTNSNRI